MGKSRSMRRVAGGEVNVFPAETSLGWRVVRIVTRVRALEKLASGEWREVQDEHGNFLGCQVLANFKRDEDLVSGSTSTSINVRECMLNAEGLKASRTARMQEEDRIARKDRFGKPLPPEDAIERAVAKVKEFGRVRLVASPITAEISGVGGWDAFQELAQVED